MDGEPNPEIKAKVQDSRCQLVFVWAFANAQDAAGIEKYLFDFRPNSCCNLRNPGGTGIMPNPLPPHWQPINRQPSFGADLPKDVIEQLLREPPPTMR